MAAGSMTKEAPNFERMVTGIGRQTSPKVDNSEKNDRESLLTNDVCIAKSAALKSGMRKHSDTSCARPWELDTVTQGGTEIKKMHIRARRKNSQQTIQSLWCNDQNYKQSLSMTCDVPAKELSAGGKLQALLPFTNRKYNQGGSQVAVDDYGYVIPQPGTIKDPRISPKTMPTRIHEAPEPMSLYETAESHVPIHICPKAMFGGTDVEVDWLSLDQTADTSGVADEKSLNTSNVDDEEDDWVFIFDTPTSSELVGKVKDHFVVL